MDAVLYCYDGDKQIDPKRITLNQGVVTQILSVNGEEHTGRELSVRTPRDFIYVKDLDIPLNVGDKIYLDNQSHQVWEVCYGWYSVDGNPSICGWYLTSIPAGRIRSLYLKDLGHLTMRTTELTITPPDEDDVTIEVDKPYIGEV